MAAGVIFRLRRLYRLYGDLGYRTPGNEIHFTASGARNTLGVIGPTPVHLLEQLGDSAVFTSPQTTVNTVGTIAFNGKFDINPQWSIASNFYMRSFEQHHTDGNDADIQNCADNGLPGSPAGFLCLASDNFPTVTNGAAFVILGQNGKPIPFADGVPYGTIDRTSVHATTFGTALQATDNDKFFEHENYFTFGASVDRSLLSFSATSQLGVIFPDFVDRQWRVPRLGRSSSAPRDRLAMCRLFSLAIRPITESTRSILSASRPELALTAGARLNIAQIVTNDATGLAPATQHQRHFFADQSGRRPDLSNLAHGHSSMAAIRRRTGRRRRSNSIAPTQISPCILGNSLVSDPPLQQVVAHTFEAGLRGGEHVFDTGQIDWKAGFFRTNSTNDIITLASTIPGREYFANVPSTLRQGAEAEANFSLWQSLGLCELRLCRCDLPVRGGLVLAKQSLRQCGWKCIRDAGRSYSRAFPAIR